MSCGARKGDAALFTVTAKALAGPVYSAGVTVESAAVLVPKRTGPQLILSRASSVHWTVPNERISIEG